MPKEDACKHGNPLFLTCRSCNLDMLEINKKLKGLDVITETELDKAYRHGVSDFRDCIINWYEAENDEYITAESLIEIIKILEV